MWLIILDDAWERLDEKLLEYELQFLTMSPHVSRCVVTSKFKLHVNLAGVCPVELSVASNVPKAQAMLASYVHNNPTREDLPTAAKVS